LKVLLGLRSFLWRITSLKGVVSGVEHFSGKSLGHEILETNCLASWHDWVQRLCVKVGLSVGCVLVLARKGPDLVV
jgi:hypothetical protein